MPPPSAVHVLGILLPESTLRTWGFSVLAAFVAVNTLMYVVLAFAKVLPKIYLHDHLGRRRDRSQTRTIYPDLPAPVRAPRPRRRTHRRHTRQGLFDTPRPVSARACDTGLGQGSPHDVPTLVGGRAGA